MVNGNRAVSIVNCMFSIGTLKSFCGLADRALQFMFFQRVRIWNSGVVFFLGGLENSGSVDLCVDWSINGLWTGLVDWCVDWCIWFEACLLHFWARLVCRLVCRLVYRLVHGLVYRLVRRERNCNLKSKFLSKGIHCLAISWFFLSFFAAEQLSYASHYVIDLGKACSLHIQGKQRQNINHSTLWKIYAFINIGPLTCLCMEPDLRWLVIISVHVH